MSSHEPQPIKKAARRRPFFMFLQNCLEAILMLVHVCGHVNFRWLFARQGDGDQAIAGAIAIIDDGVKPFKVLQRKGCKKSVILAPGRVVKQSHCTDRLMCAMFSQSFLRPLRF